MALKDSLKNSIQKMPTKTRVVIFCVALALILGVFLYLVRIPMNTQITALQKQVADKEAEIKQNDEKIRKLDELKAEVRSYQEMLAQLKEKLPPEAEVSGLLRQIQNEVNKSGLTLKLWKPEKRKPNESGLYDEIPITMKLIGGYHNLGVFLDRVARLPRIVNIQNLKMDTAKKDASGAMNINISCTAVTFAATEKKVEATAPSAPPAKKAQ